MTDKGKLKQRALAAINARRRDLVDIGNALFEIPETGFREHHTAAYVKRQLETLGLQVRDGIAITGLKTKAAGKCHDRCVGIMGELDALVLPNHCHADPKTGYGHACGHHAQLVMVLGTAMGLIESGVMQELDGDVAFLAVPAEEAVELEFRKQLVDEGKLHFMGGKQEFIRLGVFDDIDAVLCSHLSTTPNARFRYGQSYNGVVHKSVRFIGKSAHAGMAPHLGINALQAAVNAINNVNGLRETLPQDQSPRIHYIITKGGDSPNIIPDDVRMEFGVRAATAEFMMDLNDRVNRAIRAGAMAAGAQVEIDDHGAYQPTYQDERLTRVFVENAAALVGSENLIDASNLHRGSSTDVGDVASLVPTIHTNFDGAVGAPHTAEFDVADPEFAYVEIAKVMAMTVIDLLAEGGTVLDDIKSKYKPTFANKEAHMQYYRKLLSQG